MVSKKEIAKQLKGIKFNHVGWGRSEAAELPSIILPDETIYECVNGMYEGGFALLVATDIRVLLIDKKPLNFLTVEDMRFDMITQIDYNHRLMGADIGISAGSKNLRFRSYNQAKLRKLIGHVQDCMATSKKKQSSHQDSQVSHLEQINTQLQAYLSAQASYQKQLHELQQQQTTANNVPAAPPELPVPPKPSNELADYLYAQSLLAQHEEHLKEEATSNTEQVDNGNIVTNPQQSPVAEAIEVEQPSPPATNRPMELSQSGQVSEIYQEGMQEVFGNQFATTSESAQPAQNPEPTSTVSSTQPSTSNKRFEINPMQIAYSKLPTALRSRKFGESKSPKVPSPDPTATQV